LLLKASGSERYYWIAGPCRLAVKNGSIDINGAVLGSGEEIVIHRNRSYTMILSGDAEVEVSVEGGGECCEADENTVASLIEWREVANRVIEECASKGGCRVVVIGDVDSGKTTMTTLLANLALRKGLPTRLVDADVGQSSIGMPGFISATSYKKQEVWPRRMVADEMFYVGSITPAGFQDRVIHGVSKLAGSSAGMVIIDTDGWVEGSEAVDYKMRLVCAASPSHIILVTNNDRVKTIYEKIMGSVGAKILVLTPPPKRRVRSRMDRMLLRGDKVYLEEMSRTLVLPLSKHFVVGSIKLGLGEELDAAEKKRISEKLRTRVLYAEDQGDRIAVVVKGVPRGRIRGVRVYSVDTMRGMLSCIVGEGGKHLAPAIIHGFEEERRAVVVRTFVSEGVKGLLTGYIVCEGNTIRQVRGFA